MEMREVGLASPAVFDLLSFEGFIGGRTVHLTPNERSLLAYLALRTRGASSTELADAICPDLDEISGRSNVKVHVHRIRRKLGAASIASFRGNYVLHAETRSPSDCEREVRELNGSDSREDARTLEALLQRLRRRPAPGNFGWLDVHERRLVDLERRIVHLLAEHTLRSGDACRALALAEEASALDPFDEDSHAIVIRALLQSGDSAGARAALARYEWQLRREIAGYQCTTLRALFGAGGLSPTLPQYP